MQKNLRLTILVMALFSILLFLLIIGPEIGGAVAAENNNVDSLKPDVVDSSNEPTSSAIEKDNSPTDVTNEITEPEVAFQLKYDKYPLTYVYLLVQNATVNIRKGPSLTEAVLKTVSRNEKLNYIETVTKDGIWYHVTWSEAGRQYFGFINADVVTKRVFQFDKMHQEVLRAEKEAGSGSVTYIGNYHNLKGWAPLYQGEELDKDGGRRSQSAPGYPDPSYLNEFIYLGDGTLIKVLDQGSKYTRVSPVRDLQKVYYVPNKYIVMPAAVSEIKKAIVIDRGNQNEAVFEKTGEEWKVISYTLATTGKTGTYHQPTPLGYYYAIEKRERFYYYEDGTTKIQGYAPYAIRFAGGAYLHGVPVNYKFKNDGGRIDPGKVEYSKTMGTVPLSHKCVRNYTSHAKFIYDWYTPGEMIVIVME